MHEAGGYAPTTLDAQRPSSDRTGKLPHVAAVPLPAMADAIEGSHRPLRHG